MNIPPVTVQWSQRIVPLTPVAVAAVGDIALVLARRLLHDDDAGRIGRLQAAATDDALVLLGPAADLPWVDGVVYLGKDPKAGALLIPTNLVPSVPIDAVERALASRFKDVPPPVVVLPVHRRVFSAGPAVTLAGMHLRSWLGGRQ